MDQQQHNLRHGRSKSSSGMRDTNRRILPWRQGLLQCSLLALIVLAVSNLPVCQALRWPRRPSSKAKGNLNKKNQPIHYNNNNDNVEEESVLSSQQLEPLLQVPCSMQLVKNLSHRHENKRHRRITAIAAFCDTGAQRTCMSWDAAQRLGLAHLLDPRYAGQATGVGLCRVLGRIPAQTVILHFSSDDKQDVTIMAPAITILESTGAEGVELLFGLDFLRDARAVIDVQDDFIRLTGKIKQKRNNDSNNHQQDTADVEVSFVRPRQALGLDSSGKGKDNESEDGMSMEQEEPVPRRKKPTGIVKADIVSERRKNYEGDSEFEEEDDFESDEEDGMTMDFSGI